MAAIFSDTDKENNLIVCMYRGKVVDVKNLMVDTSKKVATIIYRKFINRLAVAEFDVNVDANVNCHPDENTAKPKLSLSLTLSSTLLLRSMPQPTDL